MKICIDPGHGGKDPGAVGNGLREKDITLYIALEVAQILRAAGQIVVLTRETDRFIGLTSERAPAADISVSIHVNAGGGQGAETWVSLFNRPTDSKSLGQAIQDGILTRIPFRDRGLKSRKNTAGNADYLYMLRKPGGVAVLVECGFLDSAIDAVILRSENNLKMIAQGIANGVIQYLGGAKGVIEDMKIGIEIPETKVTMSGKMVDKSVILNVEGKDTTYIPAVVLRKHGYNVDWDAATASVSIKKG